MKNICIEMPVIMKCMVSECAYNVGSNCHARAITVGDAARPGCDTFLKGAQHIKKAQHIAGIGACKTAACKFNDDLECVAEGIQVAMIKNKAHCITYAARQ